jgi:DNA-binding MarR family transcriptional regulator
MYNVDVDIARLHRLGRRLLEISRQGSGEPGDLAVTMGEAAVLEDVVANPDSPVGEIAARIGFAQSHVSVSVARLKERGLVATRADPGDARRTRVRATDHLLAEIGRRTTRRVDDVLAATLADPTTARRVGELMTELADLLIPESDGRS